MNIGHLEEIGAALCDAILQFSIFEKLLGDKRGPQMPSRIGNKPEPCYSILQHQLQHQHQIQLQLQDEHQYQLDLEVQAELELDTGVDIDVEVDVGVGGEIKDQSNNKEELSRRIGARKLNCDHDNFNDQNSEDSVPVLHQREGLIDNMVAKKGRSFCSSLPSSTSFSTSTSTAFSTLHINADGTSTDRVSCHNQSTNTGTYTFLVQLLNLLPVLFSFLLPCSVSLFDSTAPFLRCYVRTHTHQYVREVHKL